MTDKLYTYGNMPHKQFPSHREELRDKFAMAVMQGDFSAQDDVGMGYYTNDTPDEFLVKRAEFYYRMADAMLKARG
ncbi:hypothetical protein ACGE7E_002818 [Proteus mirabilis]|uniref:hypothetical protein n=1 Tax=Proteus mirabilis TaxID=584 RepID=UPI0023601BCE|nr:hypothetical protein [Proteus mirabilis]MDC9772435.1 hypothetical protein [Proteus mirabilis]